MNVLQNVRSLVSGYFQTKETPKLENVGLIDVYLENLIKYADADEVNVIQIGMHVCVL